MKLDLASESPPAIAGRLRFARCSDRRSEGDRRGWFDEAGLPAAPNTRSERPRSRSAQPRPASPFQNELLRDWFLCRHSDERTQKKAPLEAGLS